MMPRSCMLITSMRPPTKLNRVCASPDLLTFTLATSNSGASVSGGGRMCGGRCCAESAAVTRTPKTMPVDTRAENGRTISFPPRESVRNARTFDAIHDQEVQRFLTGFEREPQLRLERGRERRAQRGGHPRDVEGPGQPRAIDDRPRGRHAAADGV